MIDQDGQRVVRFCLPNLCSISSIDLIIELTEKVLFDYVRLPNSIDWVWIPNIKSLAAQTLWEVFGVWIYKRMYENKQNSS